MTAAFDKARAELVDEAARLAHEIEVMRAAISKIDAQIAGMDRARHLLGHTVQATGTLIPISEEDLRASQLQAKAQAAQAANPYPYPYQQYRSMA